MIGVTYKCHVAHSTLEIEFERDENISAPFGYNEAMVRQHTRRLVKETTHV